jgi:hypothetical protein
MQRPKATLMQDLIRGIGGLEGRPTRGAAETDSDYFTAGEHFFAV